LAPLSSAHMIMANPVPFNAPSNSPLAPDGSDFPCKGPASGSAQVNEWPVGSTQSLSFSGTAVHGGGSCQMSVTTDKTPTKDSKWKVIYSIEGGCPANVKGNLDLNSGSYNGSFPFTVPQDLPTGDFTVAWTWFNKIGNREMYMNCASVSVTGGADDASGLDALPDMAIANVNVPGSCGTTKEGADYTFSNPGAFGTTAGEGPFMDLCAGTPSQPGMGRGGSGSDGAAGASLQAPAASDAGSAMPSTFRTVKTLTAPMPPVPTNPGGVMAPSACSAAPAPKPTPAQPSQGPGIAHPTAAPAPAPAPSPVTPRPSTGLAPGSGSSTGTPCSTDGQLVCSPDGTQYGLCNFGKAVMMPVAGGTKCVNGAIAKRDDYTHRNQRTAI
ncbi:lytic polysaccharide monooxygenase, partial [Bipolaris oryzae ATCC 44560]